MSHRRRGRGRGAANPLAPPFNPHTTPSSPEDTRMDETIASPVQTVRPPHYETPDDDLTLQNFSEDLDATHASHNKLVEEFHCLGAVFDVLQQHLKLVQERHIKDTAELRKHNTKLTNHIEKLENNPVP